MAQTGTRSTRILVIEDSRVQALCLRSILTAGGFEVEVSIGGRRGLELFAASRFDLVLSDVQMPELDGYEVCRRIKASPGGSDVPVILLTYLGKPLDIIRGLESGADAYINKPYEDEYLLGRIRDILEGQGRQARAGGVADLVFAGHRFAITSERSQILGFLAATLDDIVRAGQREHRALAELMQETQRLERETHRTREDLLLEQGRGLKRASEFLQATLDALTARIAILDAGGKIVAVNAAWGDQEDGHPVVGRRCPVGTSYPESCLEAGRGGMEHGADIAADVRAVLDGQRSGTYLEYACRVAGEDRWFAVHIRRFRDADSAHVVVAHEDITQRKVAEEQLYHHAFHDPLTGLPNRALFEEHLSRAIRRAGQQEDGRFAVLFLDFDGFKLINDSLGHAVGDQLLVAIARRLEASLRRGDKVARLGGDEFVILVEEAQGLDDVARLADGIRERLKPPFSIEGHEIFITASIGIAMNPTTPDHGPRNLLRDADLAMYHAKGKGRGRYAIFHRNLHDRAIARLNLESELRRSIEHQELRVHYQPIISLGTGVISGFEALVRWSHPTRGSIDPEEFVPIAEETGLILPLGTWVLRESCNWLRAWQAQRPGPMPVTMSVNLSGRQLEQPNLVEQIDRILRETGLDPRALRLEVTESVAMKDAERATEVLQRLRRLGIRVSLDDFGTGYSSLNHLYRLPIDVLKIDRSFVSRIGDEGRNSEIVRIILMLAQQLRMEVVAEGVETMVQYEWLRSVECRYGQGYYFSRALDGDSAMALLQSGTVPEMGIEGTAPLRPGRDLDLVDSRLKSGPAPHTSLRFDPAGPAWMPAAPGLRYPVIPT
jgi:diguanylate cyclase (GGDEF)-like protein